MFKTHICRVQTTAQVSRKFQLSQPEVHRSVGPRDVPDFRPSRAKFNNSNLFWNVFGAKFNKLRKVVRV